jgi:hypothetical protein
VQQSALQEDVGAQNVQANDQVNQLDNQNSSSSKKHKKAKKEKKKKHKKQDQDSISPPYNGVRLVADAAGLSRSMYWSNPVNPRGATDTDDHQQPRGTYGRAKFN